MFGQEIDKLQLRTFIDMQFQGAIIMKNIMWKSLVFIKKQLKEYTRKQITQIRDQNKLLIHWILYHNGLRRIL